MGLIVDTFKTVWRFTMLSDSRWATVCPAAQALVVAALCGFENFVSFVRSVLGKGNTSSQRGFCKTQQRQRTQTVRHVSLGHVICNADYAGLETVRRRTLMAKVEDSILEAMETLKDKEALRRRAVQLIKDQGR